MLDGAPGDGRALSEAVADELLDELRSPFRVGGARAPAGASVGISLFPADAATPTDLLKHADAAMYQAKAPSRGGHAVYRADVDDAHRRLELTTRLRAALARDELELHYQPVFERRDRARRSAVEALIRWNDPERGMVSPAEFIPLAEDTGLIEPIGAWVLNEVVPPGARLAGPRPRRSWSRYNAAPQELASPGFARRVGERMAAHGVRPGALASRSSSPRSPTPRPSRRCSSASATSACRVAIDDFGAGFSSLTRLRHLTVHTLKLDRAFLHDVPDDVRGAGFITAMLGLADQLGLHVVAEGIETEEQLEFLRLRGVRARRRATTSRGRCRPPSVTRRCFAGRGGASSCSSRRGT